MDSKKKHDPLLVAELNDVCSRMVINNVLRRAANGLQTPFDFLKNKQDETACEIMRSIKEAYAEYQQGKISECRIHLEQAKSMATDTFTLAETQQEIAVVPQRG
ncbi:MAG: hypothetical protein V3V61_04395 [Gammaproteobacteria bacterium]